MLISIEDLEHACVAGWRAPDEEQLGDWVLRAAEGFTGRANSALAAGSPGMPSADAAQQVCRWYQARGQTGMIAVPYPVGEPHRNPVDPVLADLGWTLREDAATVMTAAAAEVAARPPDTAPPVAMIPAPDQAWLDRYHYRGQSLPPVALRLLTSAPWQAFASVRIDGQTIAIGRVAGAGDWAGLTAIEVDPAHRRRGLGAVITAALAAEALRRGFRNVYLQVADGNTTARSLYRRLGFADHHGYHYRIAPD